MRRLMLLRHAKTEHDAPSGRIRTAVSTTAAGSMPPPIGGWIGRHPPVPELVLVSTAVRAQQTWEIAWQAMQDATRPSPAAAGRIPAGTLRRRSGAAAADHPHGRDQPIPKQLMVVGHNPGMHELALALAGSGDAAGRKKRSSDNLPTTGPCDLRLCDRGLERRGVSPRHTGAVHQPETAEADVGRLRPDWTAGASHKPVNPVRRLSRET